MIILKKCIKKYVPKYSYKYLKDVSSLFKAMPKLIWFNTALCAIFSMVSLFPVLYPFYGVILLPAQIMAILEQVYISKIH